MAQQAEEFGATFTLRASAWTIVPATTGTLVALAILGYMEFASPLTSAPLSQLASTLRLIVVLVTAGFAFAWLLPTIIQWRITTLTLADDRVVVTRGLLAHSVNNIPLERVSEVRVTQRLLGRIVGVGDVELDVAPSGPPEAFLGVRHPREVQAALAAASDRLRPYGGVGLQWDQGRQEGAGSLVDHLERLEALRARGALSDEEFLQAKQRLFLES